MRTIQEIEADIAETEQALQYAQGTETEVYARIVGYYRSVRNWNKGKREEFSERQMFADDNPKIIDYISECPSRKSITKTYFYPSFLTVYTRKTCPNCPPVIEYCRTLSIPVHIVDADTDAGKHAAAEHNIRSCPSVIAYSDSGAELSRFYSVADLQHSIDERLTVQAITA